MPTPPLLALFYARFGCSRLAEFEAVAQRLGAPTVDWGWDRQQLVLNGGDIGPHIVQRLPSLAERDHPWLAEAAARSVACRGVFEVWGQGDSVEACAEQAKRISGAHILSRVTGSWRLDSVVLGATRSQHEQPLDQRMNAFGHTLDLLAPRPVRLDAPEHTLWLVEDRQRLKDFSPLPNPSPRYSLLFKLPTPTPPMQDTVRRLDLSRRAFLSTSSTPADRAMTLCNLALAGARGPDISVLDPYCGSGGLLLTAAALGAQTVGSDVDWKIVSDNRVPIRIPPSAHRPDRGVEAVRMRDNFDEAGLPQPKALLTLDVSAPDAVQQLLAANDGRRFDALVCDPPYGRREFQQGAQGWDGELTFKVHLQALRESLGELLDLARATLKPGARLVFLAPVWSRKDPVKPTLEQLVELLRVEGGRRRQTLVHIGQEVVHQSLRRAVVAMVQG